MDLSQKKRGIFGDMAYLDKTRVLIHYELPLSEIVYDFFDMLKSSTKAMHHLTMKLVNIKNPNFQKNGHLLNGEVVDALSTIRP